MSATHPFAELTQTFERAESLGVVEASYRIAEHAVRVRAAGGAESAALFKPLRHLRQGPALTAAPKLRIDIWSENDDASLPASWPPHDWTHVDFVDGPVVRSPDDRFVGFHGPGLTACLDRVDGRLIGCIRRERPLSLWESGKPLLFFWWVWLRDCGGQMIHAALVGERGEGILMAGPGGVGKSTSALLCGLAGLDFLGDDYVGVRRNSGGDWRGHSLFSSTWFTEEQLRTLPMIRDRAEVGAFGPDNKRMATLADLIPERMADAIQVKAIALPRIGDEPRTRYSRVTSAAAMVRMAPSCLLQFPISAGAGGFQSLARLAGELPVYDFVLGSDRDDIPRAVRALLGEAA